MIFGLLFRLQHIDEKSKLEKGWNSEKRDLLARHEEELKSITTSQTQDIDKQMKQLRNEVRT